MSPSWALRILLAICCSVFQCFKEDFNKNNSYQYVVNHTIIKFICIFSCMQFICSSFAHFVIKKSLH